MRKFGFVLASLWISAPAFADFEQEGVEGCHTYSALHEYYTKSGRLTDAENMAKQMVNLNCEMRLRSSSVSPAEVYRIRSEAVSRIVASDARYEQRQEIKRREQERRERLNEQLERDTADYIRSERLRRQAIRQNQQYQSALRAQQDAFQAYQRHLQAQQQQMYESCQNTPLCSGGGYSGGQGQTGFSSQYSAGGSYTYAPSTSSYSGSLSKTETPEIGKGGWETVDFGRKYNNEKSWVYKDKTYSSSSGGQKAKSVR